MKKQNDVILISLVIIIVVLIILISISMNLIFGENGIIQTIEKEQEVSTEQMNREEVRIQK